MQQDFRTEEDLVHSCRSIMHFLGAYKDGSPETIAKREVLLRDLLWRIAGLQKTEKITIMAESWYGILLHQIRSMFTREKLGIGDLYNVIGIGGKAEKDVGVVTVINPELEAFLIALNHKSPEKADVVMTCPPENRTT